MSGKAAISLGISSFQCEICPLEKKIVSTPLIMIANK